MRSHHHRNRLSWKLTTHCIICFFFRWFRQSKFSSFQRQLNIYGFTRITSGTAPGSGEKNSKCRVVLHLFFWLLCGFTGPDKGGYFHEMFLRSKQFLAGFIPRIHIKAEKAHKKRMDHPWYPDFEAMSHLPLSSSPSPSECQIPLSWKAINAASSTTGNRAVMLMVQQRQEQEQQQLCGSFVPLLSHWQSRNAIIDDEEGSFSLNNRLVQGGLVAYQTHLERIWMEAATAKYKKMNETIELQHSLVSLLLQGAIY